MSASRFLDDYYTKPVFGINFEVYCREEKSLLKRSNILTLALRDLVILAGRSPEVLHGDLSPDNLIVCSDFSVKWIDWEVKQEVGITPHWKNNFRAKKSYLSPEKAITGITTRESEIFSFGAMAYEALCSRKLFRCTNDSFLPSLYYGKDNWIESMSLVPINFYEVIKKAIHPIPSSRFRSFEDFLLQWQDSFLQSG